MSRCSSRPSVSPFFLALWISLSETSNTAASRSNSCVKPLIKSARMNRTIVTAIITVDHGSEDLSDLMLSAPLFAQRCSPPLQRDRQSCAFAVENSLERWIRGNDFHVVGNHPDVMRQKESTRPDQRKDLVQIIDITFFVGIDEYHVDRRLKLRNLLMRIALDDRHEILHAGSFEMLARLLRSAMVDLKRHQMTARCLQGKTKP